MATSLPDPREFKSWEDAFQHPLPAVRKLEQQLRSNAAENREKLRSLVGGSYRDLLGTAERICDMDETMQGIETTLGLTAAQCNSGVVEKIFGNAAKLEAESGSRSAQQNGLAAQLSVLRNCQSAMTQLLKNGDRLSVAAKVLVLGRLIHKTLSKQADAPPLVDGLRHQLTTSRARLLKSIDRSFSDPSLDNQLLVSNMCAYSLATSSAPTDVLEHFLRVRLKAIRSLSPALRQARNSMIKAIKLFKSSLAAVHAIFPKRLGDALSKVKLQPLLQDKEIRSLAELNLDIYERWIADEVRNFTPWPRHDELQRPEAERIAKTWIPAALSSVKSTLETILNEQREFESVLKLREAVLEAHLTSNERAPGAQPSDVLDIIREALNQRLIDLIKLEADGVAALTVQINSTINISSSLSKPTDGSLWELANEDSSLSNGSAIFKNTIRGRLHGFNKDVSQCIESSEAWEVAVAKARALIRGMRERRWEDDILDAGVEGDDDFDLDSMQALLGEDDPRMLEEALDDALGASLINFSTSVNELIENSDEAGRAVFLIRVLRDLAQKTSSLSVDFDHVSVCQPLFEIVASSSAEEGARAHEAALAKLTEARRLPEAALWEGHPALPSQPMTSSFKLLRSVTRSMAYAGQDLWSPALVERLKVILLNRLKNNFETAIEGLKASAIENPETALVDGSTNGISNGVDEEVSEEVEGKAESSEEAGEAPTEPAVNGDGSEGEQDLPQDGDQPETTTAETSPAIQPEQDATDVRKTKARQLLFDIYYLQRALSVSTPGMSTGAILQSVARTTLDEAGFEPSEDNKVKKSANDYWRKSYLLFGLLV